MAITGTITVEAEQFDDLLDWHAIGGGWTMRGAYAMLETAAGTPPAEPPVPSNSLPIPPGTLVPPASPN